MSKTITWAVIERLAQKHYLEVICENKFKKICGEKNNYIDVLLRVGVLKYLATAEGYMQWKTGKVVKTDINIFQVVKDRQQVYIDYLDNTKSDILAPYPLRYYTLLKKVQEKKTSRIELINAVYKDYLNMKRTTNKKNTLFSAFDRFSKEGLICINMYGKYELSQAGLMEVTKIEHIIGMGNLDQALKSNRTRNRRQDPSC